MKKFILPLLAFLALVPGSAAYACTSCGCTLSPEWIAEGYTPKPGLRLDFRYDFIDQSELRRGRHEVSKSSFALPSADEVQLDTRTSFYTAALDYTGQGWGVRVEAPLLDRYHTTIAPGDVMESASDKTGIGDVRIVGRWHGFGDGLTGLQFGVKLPTGDYKQNFQSGPQAGGGLDRGLQLGTGTTDVIAGVYNLGYFDHMRFSRFEQLLVKVPVGQRAGFRPSTTVNLNAGVQYLALSSIIPQFQLNAKFEGRESGANADRPNSGSMVLYASPGLTYRINPKAQVYGFAQLPLYQDYNGLQLAPEATFSFGIVYSLF